MAFGNTNNGGGATPMTAGQKAAATRRANRAAGIPPKTKNRSPRTRGGPAFTAPKPDYRSLKIVALAALEDVFVLKLRDAGITPEARKGWEVYQKLKALALAPTASPAAQIEADSALRMATANLVKLAY
jgi:hypothetical protein